MRIKSAFLLAAGLILAGLGSCGDITLPEVSRRLINEVRVHPTPQNGYLRLSQSYVPDNDYVTIYANPAPGYILEVIWTQNESGFKNRDKWGATPVLSVQIAGHTAVTADFKPKDPGKFTISFDPNISGGIIYSGRYADDDKAPTMSESSGTKIKLTILPEPGMDIAEGSLKVKGVTSGTEVSVSPVMPYVFLLPGEDVMVEARFEKLQPQDLKERAGKYLETGEYDTAAELYESAWKQDQNDPELIFYSTFGLLGNLLIDYDFRVMLGSLYFNPVPGTINDWVCDNIYWTGAGTGTNRWYTDYAATVYTPKDAKLPRFNSRFSGFDPQFGDSTLAQQPGRGHLEMGKTQTDTREKFINYIFWALISSYRSGFNPLVEKVNRYAFGKKFEEALARSKSFPNGAKVKLNPRLVDRFHLDDIYAPDNGDYFVGKPELEYIFGNLLAVRAVFNYLSAYDLSVDLRNWTFGNASWDEGLNEILGKMFDLQDIPKFKDLWRDPGTVVKMLPFKNNFLRIRDARGITKAKEDITRALAMTNYAMDCWYGSSADSSRFTDTAKNERQWAKQAWAQVKDAMEGGNNGIFYFTSWFPRNEGVTSWPNASSGEFHPDKYDGYVLGPGGLVPGAPGDEDVIEVRRNRIYGVNVSKFFTPGAFTLTKLFTTDLGGTAPSLYKIEWYEDHLNNYIPVYTGNYFPVTAQFNDGNARDEIVINGTKYTVPFKKYSFEVNTANLKELFPKGFGTLGDANGGKELVYKVFPSIPLWPWAVTYFSNNSPASKLYDAYHKTTID